MIDAVIITMFFMLVIIVGFIGYLIDVILRYNGIDTIGCICDRFGIGYSRRVRIHCADGQRRTIWIHESR